MKTKQKCRRICSQFKKRKQADKQWEREREKKTNNNNDATRAYLASKGN
jgi:hypothetical protein